MDASGSRGEREEVPKLQPIRKPFSVTAVSVFGLFILAMFYTLYFAREFFLPLTLAWVISLLLKPVVRAMVKIRIPEVLATLVLLISLLAAVLTGLLFLSAPASAWIEKVPQSLEKVETKLRSLTTSAQQLSAAAQSVQHLTETTADETPKVELKKPGLFNVVLSQTKSAILMAAEVFVLVFFFLAAGDVFTLKLIQVLPRLRDKKRALEIVRETEKGISQYLLAMTLVNLYEGVAIGLGLGLLGLPNPVLWGVLAFAANYVPYLGALAAGSIITVVSLVSFDSVGRALIAPAIYFGVNFSDNFISPFIMGRRLVLNPVVVFLAVMFWGWVWGIAGVLLAVPMTMIIKIVCDRSAVLAPLAEFMTAQRPEKSAQPAEVFKGAYVRP